MWYPVRKALQFVCEQSGIFPAKCTDWERWAAFSENSSRDVVEKLYRFWALASDFEEKDVQRIESVLRSRLQRLERPRLEANFVNAHKDKIFWVHSSWNSKDIFSYMQWEKRSDAYPFYVVDQSNNLRGIAVEEGFIFAGALNFAISVDEAELFFAQGGFQPLTEEDAACLNKNRAKIKSMMRAVGMQEINGGYLLVNAQTNAWRGQWISKRIAFLPKRSFKGYFLLAKL